MKNYRSDEVKTEDMPTGLVRISPHGTGWFLVQIGRGRYTKRFNLSTDELRQLAEQYESLVQ